MGQRGRLYLATSSLARAELLFLAPVLELSVVVEHRSQSVALPTAWGLHTVSSFWELPQPEPLAFWLHCTAVAPQLVPIRFVALSAYSKQLWQFLTTRNDASF